MKQYQKTSEEKVELPGILGEFRQALEDEIHQIEKSGQSSTILSGGRLVASKDGGFWYQFSVDYMPNTPPDTPAKLVVGRDTYNVIVISVEENKIIISSANKLPDSLGKVKLNNGTTALMEFLIKCIEDNADNENPAGRRMLAIKPEDEVVPFRKIAAEDSVTYNSDTLNSGQKNAILQAVTNDITYIWGPPGTGKTTVIGEIIRNLYCSNRSVLVVSHTNTAVDGAIKKAAKLYCDGKIKQSDIYPILRIGVSKGLDKRCTLQSHIQELGKDLYAQKKELEENQAEIHNRLNEIIPILRKAIWIEQSQLPEMSPDIVRYEQLKQSAEKVQLQIKDIDVSIQKEIEQHPEAQQFYKLSGIMGYRGQVYSAICDRYKNTCDSIRELPLLIQTAEDEIKKHTVYEELCVQESKMMSQSFYMAEISKTQNEIGVKQQRLQQLERDKRNAEDTISRYESKNSFARIFSDKNAYIKAKEGVHAVTAAISEIKADIQTSESLCAGLNEKLNTLHVLLAEKKSVAPSKTVSYWTEHKAELQKQLSNARISLPEIEKQKAEIDTEITELKKQIAVARPAWETVHQLEISKKDSIKQYQNISSDMQSLKTHFTEVLKHEQALISIEIKADLIETLKCQMIEYDSVRKEVEDEDISGKKDESEKLNQQLLDIHKKLSEIQEKMQELERQAIMQARIVGATLTKTYISPILRERKFDTVILDEASMASIPALWCASYLAEKNIVLVGDFLQLPPIVMANTDMAKKWLGRDIFDHSGIQESMNCHREPQNCAKLNDQFRMESAIANIANLYYGAYGGLRSNDMSPKRCENRDKFKEWYPDFGDNSCIRLIDTESLHAWVTGIPQGKSHSRLNCFSAAVSVDLAFKCLENKIDTIRKTKDKQKEPSVLIVAPYKPHIKYIEKLIEQRYRDFGISEDPNLINCGTIHSFQGNEADIVIFDLVIDEPHWKANLFMTGEEINKDLERMFNVAVTRAKFKLFIVGDFKYCMQRAKDNALSRLLHYLIDEQKYKLEDAKNLLTDLIFSKSECCTADKPSLKGYMLCKEDTYFKFLFIDLKNFRERVIIYSPFITEDRLAHIESGGDSFLTIFENAKRMGKRVIVITKPISERTKAKVASYKKCEQQLRDRGVYVLHKKGMHEKMVLIDSDVVWTGSLNSLSFAGNTGELMERQAGQEIIKAHEDIFDIKHVCEVASRKNEQCCPICGGEMQVRESDNGGIYWECVNKDYTRSAEQQYPADGIIRCKCGAPYQFVMKNQPRWVCTANPAHYQIMRESDLKLEKMKALIPTKKALKEVEKYFSDRHKEYEKEYSVKTGTVKKTAGKDSNLKVQKQDGQISLFELNH